MKSCTRVSRSFSISIRFMSWRTRVGGKSGVGGIRASALTAVDLVAYMTRYSTRRFFTSFVRRTHYRANTVSTVWNAAQFFGILFG